MTSSPAFSYRLVKFSEADVKSSEKQENANTKNETSWKLTIFKEFLASEEEMRKLKSFLPPGSNNLRLRLCLVLERKLVGKTHLSIE